MAVLDRTVAGKLHVRHWECFDLLDGSRKNANKVPSRKLREMLWTSLDRRNDVFFDGGVPHDRMAVGIEMQMKQKMAILETTIWAYFKSRNIHAVESIHARKKFHLPWTRHVSMGSYAHNKKQAIIECERYLSEHGHAAQCAQLRASGKKDDLSDAMLQALYLSENYFAFSNDGDHGSGSAGNEEGTDEEDTGNDAAENTYAVDGT